MHHHVWVEADCFFFLSLFIRSVLCHYKKVVVRNTVWRLHRSLTGRCKDHPYQESTVFICWMRACKTMTVIDLNLKITSPSICFMQGQWGKGGLHPGRVAWLSQGWHPETNNHKHKHSHLKGNLSDHEHCIKACSIQSTNRNFIRTISLTGPVLSEYFKYKYLLQVWSLVIFC